MRVKDYTVTLLTVFVVGVETFLPDGPLPENADCMPLERVELVYEDFVVRYNGRDPATGDDDTDGQVDLRDALAFQQCVGATIPGGEDCITGYDFDRDGAITTGDQPGFNAAMTGP